MVDKLDHALLLSSLFQWFGFLRMGQFDCCLFGMLNVVDFVHSSDVVTANFFVVVMVDCCTNVIITDLVHSCYCITILTIGDCRVLQEANCCIDWVKDSKNGESRF